MSKYKVIVDDLTAFNDLVSRASNGYVWFGETSDIYPIDPETGLPSLPEGYFWRVFEKYDRPRVGLYFRKETLTEVPTLFGFLTGKTKTKVSSVSRFINDRHIDMTLQVPEAAILTAANHLLSHLPGHLLKETSPMDFKSFYGDYPPKSLLTD